MKKELELYEGNPLLEEEAEADDRLLHERDLEDVDIHVRERILGDVSSALERQATKYPLKETSPWGPVEWTDLEMDGESVEAADPDEYFPLRALYRSIRRSPQPIDRVGDLGPLPLSEDSQRRYLESVIRDGTVPNDLPMLSKSMGTDEHGQSPHENPRGHYYYAKAIAENILEKADIGLDAMRKAKPEDIAIMRESFAAELSKAYPGVSDEDRDALFKFIKSGANDFEQRDRTFAKEAVADVILSYSLNRQREIADGKLKAAATERQEAIYEESRAEGERIEDLFYDDEISKTEMHRLLNNVEISANERLKKIEGSAFIASAHINALTPASIRGRVAKENLENLGTLGAGIAWGAMQGSLWPLGVAAGVMAMREGAEGLVEKKADDQLEDNNPLSTSFSGDRWWDMEGLISETIQSAGNNRYTDAWSRNIMAGDSPLDNAEMLVSYGRQAKRDANLGAGRMGAQAGGVFIGDIVPLVLSGGVAGSFWSKVGFRGVTKAGEKIGGTEVMKYIAKNKAHELKSINGLAKLQNLAINGSTHMQRGGGRWAMGTMHAPIVDMLITTQSGAPYTLDDLSESLIFGVVEGLATNRFDRKGLFLRNMVQATGGAADDFLRQTRAIYADELGPLGEHREERKIDPTTGLPQVSYDVNSMIGSALGYSFASLTMPHSQMMIVSDFAEARAYRAHNLELERTVSFTKSLLNVFSAPGQYSRKILLGIDPSSPEEMRKAYDNVADFMFDQRIDHLPKGTVKKISEEINTAIEQGDVDALNKAMAKLRSEEQGTGVIPRILKGTEGGNRITGPGGLIDRVSEVLGREEAPSDTRRKERELHKRLQKAIKERNVIDPDEEALLRGLDQSLEYLYDKLHNELGDDHWSKQPLSVKIKPDQADHGDVVQGIKKAQKARSEAQAARAEKEQRLHEGVTGREKPEGSRDKKATEFREGEEKKAEEKAAKKAEEEARSIRLREYMSLLGTIKRLQKEVQSAARRDSYLGDDARRTLISTAGRVVDNAYASAGKFDVPTIEKLSSVTKREIGKAFADKIEEGRFDALKGMAEVFEKARKHEIARLREIEKEEEAMDKAVEEPVREPAKAVRKKDDEGFKRGNEALRSAVYAALKAGHTEGGDPVLSALRDKLGLSPKDEDLDRNLRNQADLFVDIVQGIAEEWAHRNGEHPLRFYEKTFDNEAVGVFDPTTILDKGNEGLRDLYLESFYADKKWHEDYGNEKAWSEKPAHTEWTQEMRDEFLEWASLYPIEGITGFSLSPARLAKIMVVAKNGNIRSLVHELGHVIRAQDVLSPQMKAEVDSLVGRKAGDESAWTRKQEEVFAEAFERWFWEGEAPLTATPVMMRAFARISDHIKRIMSLIWDKLSMRWLDVSDIGPDEKPDLYERDVNLKLEPHQLAELYIKELAEKWTGAKLIERIKKAGIEEHVQLGDEPGDARITTHVLEDMENEQLARILYDKAPEVIYEDSKIFEAVHTGIPLDNQFRAVFDALVFGRDDTLFLPEILHRAIEGAYGKSIDEKHPRAVERIKKALFKRWKEGKDKIEKSLVDRDSFKDADEWYSFLVNRLMAEEDRPRGVLETDANFVNRTSLRALRVMGKNEAAEKLASIPWAGKAEADVSSANRARPSGTQLQKLIARDTEKLRNARESGDAEGELAAIHSIRNNLEQAPEERGSHARLIEEIDAREAEIKEEHGLEIFGLKPGDKWNYGNKASIDIIEDPTIAEGKEVVGKMMRPGILKNGKMIVAPHYRVLQGTKVTAEAEVAPPATPEPTPVVKKAREEESEAKVQNATDATVAVDPSNPAERQGLVEQIETLRMTVEELQAVISNLQGSTPVRLSVSEGADPASDTEERMRAIEDKLDGLTELIRRLADKKEEEDLREEPTAATVEAEQQAAPARVQKLDKLLKEKRTKLILQEGDAQGSRVITSYAQGGAARTVLHIGQSSGNDFFLSVVTKDPNPRDFIVRNSLNEERAGSYYDPQLYRNKEFIRQQENEKRNKEETAAILQTLYDIPEETSKKHSSHHQYEIIEGSDVVFLVAPQVRGGDDRHRGYFGRKENLRLYPDPDRTTNKRVSAEELAIATARRLGKKILIFDPFEWDRGQWLYADYSELSEEERVGASGEWFQQGEGAFVDNAPHRPRKLDSGEVDGIIKEQIRPSENLVAVLGSTDKRLQGPKGPDQRKNLGFFNLKLAVIRLYEPDKFEAASRELDGIDRIAGEVLIYGRNRRPAGATDAPSSDALASKGRAEHTKRKGEEKPQEDPKTKEEPTEEELPKEIHEESPEPRDELLNEGDETDPRTPNPKSSGIPEIKPTRAPDQKISEPSEEAVERKKLANFHIEEIQDIDGIQKRLEDFFPSQPERVEEKIEAMREALYRFTQDKSDDRYFVMSTSPYAKWEDWLIKNLFRSTVVMETVGGDKFLSLIMADFDASGSSYISWDIGSRGREWLHYRERHLKELENSDADQSVRDKLRAEIEKDRTNLRKMLKIGPPSQVQADGHLANPEITGFAGKPTERDIKALAHRIWNKEVYTVDHSVENSNTMGQYEIINGKLVPLQRVSPVKSRLRSNTSRSSPGDDLLGDDIATLKYLNDQDPYDYSQEETYTYVSAKGEEKGDASSRKRVSLGRRGKAATFLEVFRALQDGDKENPMIQWAMGPMKDNGDQIIFRVPGRIKSLTSEEISREIEALGKRMGVDDLERRLLTHDLFLNDTDEEARMERGKISEDFGLETLLKNSKTFRDNYLRSVLASDDAYVRLLGDDYAEIHTGKSGDISGARNLNRRLKLVLTNGTPYDPIGIKDRHSQRYAKEGINYVIAKDYEYDGKEEASDGSLIVSQELFDSMLLQRGLPAGLRAIKEVLYQKGDNDEGNDKGKGAIAAKMAVYRATDSQQGLFREAKKKYGTDLDMIIFGESAKLWGRREMVGLADDIESNGYGNWHIPDDPDVVKQRVYNVKAGAFRHMFGEHIESMADASVLLPSQLMWAIDPTVSPEARAAFDATRKYLEQLTQQSVDQFARAEGGDKRAFLEILHGLDPEADRDTEAELGLSRDEIAEARDIADILRNLRQVEDMPLLISHFLSKAVQNRMVRTQINRLLRPRVTGGIGVLWPMSNSILDTQKMHEATNMDLGDNLGPQAPLSQDEAILPYSAREHMVPDPENDGGFISLFELWQRNRANNKATRIVVTRVPIGSIKGIAALRVKGFHAETGTGVITHPTIVKGLLAGDHDIDKVFALFDLPQQLIEYLSTDVNQWAKDSETGLITLPQSGKPNIPGEAGMAKLKKVPWGPASSIDPAGLYSQGLDVRESIRSLGAFVSGSSRMVSLYRDLRIRQLAEAETDGDPKPIEFKSLRRGTVTDKSGRKHDLAFRYTYRLRNEDEIDKALVVDSLANPRVDEYGDVVKSGYRDINDFFAKVMDEGVNLFVDANPTDWTSKALIERIMNVAFDITVERKDGPRGKWNKVSAESKDFLHPVGEVAPGEDQPYRPKQKKLFLKQLRRTERYALLDAVVSRNGRDWRNDRRYSLQDLEDAGVMARGGRVQYLRAEGSTTPERDVVYDGKAIEGTLNMYRMSSVTTELSNQFGYDSLFDPNRLSMLFLLPLGKDRSQKQSFHHIGLPNWRLDTVRWVASSVHDELTTFKRWDEKKTEEEDEGKVVKLEDIPANRHKSGGFFPFKKTRLMQEVNDPAVEDGYEIPHSQTVDIRAGQISAQYFLVVGEFAEHDLYTDNEMLHGTGAGFKRSDKKRKRDRKEAAKEDEEALRLLEEDIQREDDLHEVRQMNIELARYLHVLWRNAEKIGKGEFDQLQQEMVALYGPSDEALKNSKKYGEIARLKGVDVAREEWWKAKLENKQYVANGYNANWGRERVESFSKVMRALAIATGEQEKGEGSELFPSRSRQENLDSIMLYILNIMNQDIAGGERRRLIRDLAKGYIEALKGDDRWDDIGYETLKYEEKQTWSDYNVVDLKAHMKAIGMRGYSGKRKAELVKRLTDELGPRGILYEAAEATRRRAGDRRVLSEGFKINLFTPYQSPSFSEKAYQFSARGTNMGLDLDGLGTQDAWSRIIKSSRELYKVVVPRVEDEVQPIDTEGYTLYYDEMEEGEYVESYIDYLARGPNGHQRQVIDDYVRGARDGKWPVSKLLKALWKANRQAGKTDDKTNQEWGAINSFLDDATPSEYAEFTKLMAMNANELGLRIGDAEDPVGGDATLENVKGFNWGFLVGPTVITGKHDKAKAMVASGLRRDAVNLIKEIRQEREMDIRSYLMPRYRENFFATPFGIARRFHNGTGPAIYYDKEEEQLRHMNPILRTPMTRGEWIVATMAQSRGDANRSFQVMEGQFTDDDGRTSYDARRAQISIPFHHDPIEAGEGRYFRGRRVAVQKAYREAGLRSKLFKGDKYEYQQELESLAMMLASGDKYWPLIATDGMIELINGSSEYQTETAKLNPDDQITVPKDSMALEKKFLKEGENRWVAPGVGEGSGGYGSYEERAARHFPLLFKDGKWDERMVSAAIGLAGKFRADMRTHADLAEKQSKIHDKKAMEYNAAIANEIIKEEMMMNPNLGKMLKGLTYSKKTGRYRVVRGYGNKAKPKKRAYIDKHGQALFDLVDRLNGEIIELINFESRTDYIPELWATEHLERVRGEKTSRAIMQDALEGVEGDIRDLLGPLGIDPEKILAMDRDQLRAAVYAPNSVFNREPSEGSKTAVYSRLVQLFETYKRTQSWLNRTVLDEIHETGQLALAGRKHRLSGSYRAQKKSGHEATFRDYDLLQYPWEREPKGEFGWEAITRSLMNGDLIGPEMSLSAAWERYNKDMSEGLYNSIGYAFAKSMIRQFPTKTQRDVANYQLEQGTGDIPRALKMKILGQEVDLGDTATLRWMNSSIDRTNAVRKLFFLKPIDKLKTHDDLLVRAHNNALLMTLAMLSGVGTFFNNVGGVRNAYVTMGRMFNPINPSAIPADITEEIRDAVASVEKWGNQTDSLAAVEYEVKHMLASDKLHPWVKSYIEKAYSDFKGKANAWDFGKFVAISLAKSMPTPPGMKRDQEAVLAHRAALAEVGKFLTWPMTQSEKIVRAFTWRNAAYEHAQFMSNGADNFDVGNMTESQRIAMIRYANQYTDMASFMFTRWGKSEFQRTAIGSVMMRFKGWMMQDNELSSQIYGDMDLTGPFAGSLRAAYRTLGNLGPGSKPLSRMEKIQKRWAKAQFTAWMLSFAARAGLLHTGTSGATKLMAGLASQIGWGFSSQLNSLGGEVILNTVDIMMALEDLWNAENDEEREKALEFIEELFSLWGPAPIMNAILLPTEMYITGSPIPNIPLFRSSVPLFLPFNYFTGEVESLDSGVDK